jgi:hypothetical protein
LPHWLAWNGAADHSSLPPRLQQLKKAEHRKSVRFFGLTLAGSQSVLFVMLSAIFPIVTKTCL